MKTSDIARETLDTLAEKAQNWDDRAAELLATALSQRSCYNCPIHDACDAYFEGEYAKESYLSCCDIWAKALKGALDDQD